LARAGIDAEDALAVAARDCVEEEACSVLGIRRREGKDYR
jgi:hypothetical protein